LEAGHLIRDFCVLSKRIPSITLKLKFAGSTYIVAKPLQVEKAKFSMLVMLPGIDKLIRPPQPDESTLDLITVTPSANVNEFSILLSGNKVPTLLMLGIVTLVRPVQPENAELPMLLTLFGIFTLVSPIHDWNA